MKKTTVTKYAVPALDKGMEVLEYLASQTVHRSQSEIAQGVKRSPNEIYRVLVALEKRGYLMRDEVSGKYHVSLKLYTLTRSIFPVHQMRQAAMPHMDELSANLGLRCHLSMLYKSQAMIIVEARSPGPVSLTMPEGAVFPLTPTASGRILLANSRPEVQSMLLERDVKFQKMTEEQRQNTILRLEHIRMNGYDFSESEITRGVTDCAAIIGQPNGTIIASLAVSLFSSSMIKPIERDKLIASLQQTARFISIQVGLDMPEPFYPSQP